MNKTALLFGYFIASTAAGSGCAAFSARVPDGFADRAEDFEIDHPFLGFSGTKLEGYELEASFAAVISGWSGDLDASDDIAIVRDGEVVWQVQCDSRASTEVWPPIRLICLYAPASSKTPPMTLAVTASAGEALSGVFFSADGPWAVEGTLETGIGANAPDTIGWSLRRLTTKDPQFFADTAMERISAQALPEASPEDRRSIAPLILTLAKLRDARKILRGSSGGGSASGGSGGVSIGISIPETYGHNRGQRLPLPPPASPGSTTHERHAAELAAIGEHAAARALWAVIRAQAEKQAE